MSSSIDQRIVSMVFDNSKFESNAKESINTLNKLNESVKSTTSANSLSNLGESLTNATKGFSTAHIESGLDNLKHSFSVLEVAAITAISNITTALMGKLGNVLSNTIGQIYSGGLKRAQNLEQANFSMMGLLSDAKEVAKIMGADGPVQAAVSGTAYGLDEAALAASNLVATGLTTEELGTPLKVISGLAAQTGRSYSMMADVITDSYAKGYASNMEISRLQEQGINAFAELKKYYKEVKGVEYEVDELFKMASKKAISAEDFSNALFHFYENAARANETYSGSLSNLKAALSRIGEKLETPKLQNMTNIFNALRTMVNQANKAIDPFLMKIVELSTAVSNFAVEKINAIEKVLKKITDVTNQRSYLPEEIEELTKGMSKIEKMEFLKKLDEEIHGPIGRVLRGFDNLLAAAKNIGSAFGTIFKPLVDTIKQFNIFDEYVGSISVKFENFSRKLLSASEKFKEFVASEKFMVNHGYFLYDVLMLVLNAIQLSIKFVTTFAKTFVGLLKPAIEKTVYAFENILQPIVRFLSDIGEIIRENNLIALSFSKLASVISGVLGPVFNWIYATFFTDTGTPYTLYNLYDWFEKLTDIIAHGASALSDWLEKETDFSSWGNNITRVLEKVLTFLTPVGEGFVRLKNKVVGFFKGLISESEGYTLFDSLAKIFEKLANAINVVGEKLKEGFTKIKEAFNGVNINNLMVTTAGGLTLFGAGGIIYYLVDLIKNLKKPKGLSNLEALLTGIQETIVSLRDTFQNIEQQLKLKAIKDFGVAIGIMAASLLVLSMIEPKKLATATVALGAAIAELVVGFKQLQGNNDKQIKKTVTAIRNLSIAILLLSVAFKSLAELSWDEIGKGTAALAAIFTLIISYIASIEKIAGNSESIVKGSSTLIGLAIAIDLLVIAVKKLGETDVGTLMKGITSVGLLLTGLMIFTKFAEADNMSFSAGAGILLMASALVIMANVVKKFGEMNPAQLAQGLLALGFALLEIGVFMAMLNETKPMAAATGMLIAAVAIKILTSALTTLAAVDSVALTTALLSIGVALGIIALTLAVMNETASIGTAAGLFIAAAAVATLSEALMVLSLVPANKLAISILAMAAALAVIGVASYLLEPVAGIMVVVSGAMTLFGVGLLACAAAMAIMTPIMALFATSLVGSLEILLSGFIAMRDTIAEALINLIAMIAEVLITSVDQFVSIIVAIGSSVLTAIIELLPLVFETLSVFLTGIVDFIVEFVPYIVDAGLQMVTGILTGIANNIGDIVSAGMMIVTNFILGIAEGLPDLIDAGFKLIISYINGLAEAIKENAYELGAAAWNLIEAIITGIGDAIKGFRNKSDGAIGKLGSSMWEKLKSVLTIKNFFNLMVSLIGGLINGIWSALKGIVNAVIDLGKSIFNALKEWLSFDKIKEVGSNIINGLIDGVKSLAGKAVDAVKNIGSSILGGFKSILGINSPSKKFKEAGNNIVDGIDEGMNEKKEGPLTAIGNIASGLLNKFQSLFSKEKGAEVGADYVTGVNSGMSSVSSKSTVSSIISDLTNGFMKYDEFLAIGQNIMEAFRKGIKAKAQTVVEEARATANNIIKQTKNVMVIKSPSRVFIGIGEYCMEGLAIGLGETRQVDKQIESLRDTLTSSLSSKLVDVDDGLTITPVLDLSEIQNGMSSIDGMFNNSPSLLGSISGNFRTNNSGSLTDAINNLTNRLNQRMDEELTADDIYEAIKTGAANAQFNVLLNGRAITSMVNDQNAESIVNALSYIGG